MKAGEHLFFLSAPFYLQNFHSWLHRKWKFKEHLLAENR